MIVQTLSLLTNRHNANSIQIGLVQWYVFSEEVCVCTWRRDGNEGKAIWLEEKQDRPLRGGARYKVVPKKNQKVRMNGVLKTLLAC
jgi:hypothetical protein